MWRAELSHKQKIFLKTQQIKSSNNYIMSKFCRNARSENKLIYQINWWNKNNHDYHSGWRIDIQPPHHQLPVLTSGWHTRCSLWINVQCLSEENPVVLRATWPGEVAGRIVYCNINFCLIIDASEEWKKKKDTNYSVVLLLHFPPPDPRREGGSLCSLTLVEFCVIGMKVKSCLSKSGPWED